MTHQFRIDTQEGVHRGPFPMQKTTIWTPSRDYATATEVRTAWADLRSGHHRLIFVDEKGREHILEEKDAA